VASTPKISLWPGGSTSSSEKRTIISAAIFMAGDEWSGTKERNGAFSKIERKCDCSWNPPSPLDRLKISTAASAGKPATFQH
jgi:hypothetical protein